MTLPISSLIPGNVYYGRHTVEERCYFLRYLGEAKWSSGYGKLYQNDYYGNNPYSVNSNKIQPLYEVTVFPKSGEVWGINYAHGKNGYSNIDEVYVPEWFEDELPLEVPKVAKKTHKYRILNAPRTDNTEAVFRDF